MKCNDWKQHFKKRNMEYYTFSVKQPSAYKKYQYISHTRGCPSPKKKVRETWHDTTARGTQGTKLHHHQKGHVVTYSTESPTSNEDYLETARQRSERSFNETWNEKERVREERQYNDIRYTRIERAFTANAISQTTEAEIECDEAKAKTAAADLRTEFESMDLEECMLKQQSQIEALTQELEELRKGRQPSTISINTHHSTPTTDPPTIISTKVELPGPPPMVSGTGEFSYTMNVVLEKYDTLDEDSKSVTQICHLNRKRELTKSPHAQTG